MNVEVSANVLRIQPWKFFLWVDDSEIYHNCASALNIKEIQVDYDKNFGFKNRVDDNDWWINLCRTDVIGFREKFGSQYNIVNPWRGNDFLSMNSTKNRRFLYSNFFDFI